jgi:Tfp pilus assembly protein FimT
MRGALRSSAVRSATLELLAGVQQTRASSIVAARPGTLCLADGAGRCLQRNGPATSWHAFLRDGDREVQLAGHSLPSGIVLRASRPRLEFWPDSLAASTITLTICDSHGLAAPRAVVISQTGRVRLANGATGSCAT